MTDALHDGNVRNVHSPAEQPSITHSEIIFSAAIVLEYPTSQVKGVNAQPRWVLFQDDGSNSGIPFTHNHGFDIPNRHCLVQ